MGCNAIADGFGPITSFGFEAQYAVERVGPYLASNGHIYLVKIDGGTTQQLKIVKSKDKGLTWEDLTGVGAGFTNGGGDTISLSASNDSGLFFSAASVAPGGFFALYSVANWTRTPGATFNTVLNVFPGFFDDDPTLHQIVISVTTPPSEVVRGLPQIGSTVTADGQTYTFASAADVAANVAPNLVALPSYPGDGSVPQVVDAAIRNMLAAMTGGAGSGTAYSSSTTAVPGLAGNFGNYFTLGYAPTLSLSVAFYTDILHILIGTQETVGTDPRGTIIKRFDTSVDTWLDDLDGPSVAGNTDNAEIDPDTASATMVASERFWLVILSDGTMRVAHAGPRETVGGFDKERVYVDTSSDGGATWDGGVEIPGQAASSDYFAISQILVDSQDRCVYLLNKYTATTDGFTGLTHFTSSTVQSITQNSGGGFDTMQEIATDIALLYKWFPSFDTWNGVPAWLGLGWAYVESGTDKIAVPYTSATQFGTPADMKFETPANVVLRCDSGANPTWSVETVDSTLPAMTFAFTRGPHTATIFSNGVLWCLWLYPTELSAVTPTNDQPYAGKVYYSQNSGSGWGAPVQLLSRDGPEYPDGVWPGIVDGSGNVGVDISVINTVDLFISAVLKANSFAQWFCGPAAAAAAGFDDPPYYRKPAYPG